MQHLPERMKIAAIGEERHSQLREIAKVLNEKGAKADFLRIDKLGLYTHGSKTDIIYDNKEIDGYDAVMLLARPSLTQFVEPLLDEFGERGIYCQAQPQAYYIVYNKPLLYSILNSRSIPIGNAIIFENQNAIEEGQNSYKFPVYFKSFTGIRKAQHIKVNNYESLMPIVRGVKGKTSTIVIQEFIPGDLEKVFVIGQKVFSIKKKWVEETQTHSDKAMGSRLSSEEATIAIKALNTVGLEIGTVEMISGKIIDVNNEMPISEFNKALGKELEKEVADFYLEKLK